MAPLAPQLFPRCEAGDVNCWLHTTTTTLLLPLPSLTGAPADFQPLATQTQTITLTYSQSGPSVVLVTAPAPAQTPVTSTITLAGGAEVVTIVSTTALAMQPTGLPGETSQTLQGMPAPTAAPTSPYSAAFSPGVAAAVSTATLRPISTSTSLAGPELRHTGGITHPNGAQVTTIWVSAVMSVCILASWQMVLLRDALYPWKLFINVIHEGSHIFVALLSGAKIHSVSIDPDRGPISGMTKGIPFVTLSAGYLGSSIVGAALIMCAFDTRASKIAWLVTLPLWLPALWFGMAWARIRVVLAFGLSLSFWFINHAAPLRFYILFCGVMCTFFVLWDAIDDFVFRKQNESDAALFSRLSAPGPHGWTAIWLLVAVGFAALGILGGLHFFTLDTASMREAQKTFMPT